MPAWSAEKPLPRLERVAAKGHREPKALCGYGLLRTDTEQIGPRFIGRCPVSHVMTGFLRWRCQQQAVEQNQVLS